MNDVAPRLREALARLLEHEADAATSHELAAAAGRLLERLARRLGLVIGQAGVQALFIRAVKLRTREFPFLGDCALGRNGSLGEPMRACLEGQEPEAITAVWPTLFTTFANLLAALIGERLAWSLLRDVWPGSPMHAQDLADEAEASRVEAEAANRRKDELLLSLVSHELRTPLNAILGWATLLGGGKLDPERAA